MFVLLGIHSKCQHCVIEELSLQEELIMPASFPYTSAGLGQAQHCD